MKEPDITDPLPRQSIALIGFLSGFLFGVILIRATIEQAKEDAKE